MSPAISLFEKKYSSDFRILIVKGGLFGDYKNIYRHSLVCGLVAMAITDLLDLNAVVSEDTIRAAILHDWHKKREIKAAEDDGVSSYHRSAEISSELLTGMVGENIANIASAAGAFDIDRVKESDKFSPLRIMFLVDAMVHGEQVVGFEERIDFLENNDRYADLNNSAIPKYGRTYFEMMRDLAAQIEDDIEDHCGIGKGKLTQEINKSISHHL